MTGTSSWNVESSSINISTGGGFARSEKMTPDDDIRVIWVWPPNKMEV